MTKIDSCSLDSQPLMTLKQAIQTILDALPPINQRERIGLKAGLGRVLAIDVISPIHLPWERNSAMDGYAFCSEDLQPGSPCQLVQIGIAWAGKPFGATVSAGECVRIFTGGVLPEGTDSVVMQEQVQVNGQFIQIPKDALPKQSVREVGEDQQAGNILLPRGKQLSPADLGLLAAVGLSEVEVVRQLRVAFFSTGDELVSVGQSLKSGQLYDSNRYILHGLLQDAIYCSTDLGVVADSPEQLRELLVSHAGFYDVIISTGGASVGDADHIKAVLASCGEVKFWKIAMKPGKPLAFGKIGNCYFFGLPGNPVAVITTFQQVVVPALNRLSGMNEIPAWRFQATCLERLKKTPGRLEFQRGILSQNPNGGFEVRPAGKQGSNLLASFSRANCYIILEATCAGVQVGEKVVVEPF